MTPGERLVSRALDEWHLQGQWEFGPGRRTTGSTPAAPVDPTQRYGGTRDRWSAAFIAHLFGETGPVHDHAMRFRAALLGLDGWRAHAVSAWAPRPGDLLLRRGSMSEHPSREPLCLEVVVDARASRLQVIGGNIDSNVALEHVPVDHAGRLHGSPWLAVLEHAPQAADA